jgi:hypothetical protein
MDSAAVRLTSYPDGQLTGYLHDWRPGTRAMEQKTMDFTGKAGEIN